MAGSALVTFRAPTAVLLLSSLLVAACSVPDECDGDRDGSASPACGGDDCDDANHRVLPDGVEVCDGLDNDCDGTVDGPVVINPPGWYADADADGFGDPLSIELACSRPEGHVINGLDCDDGDAAIRPDALELCDGLDNDCDGDVDEPDAPLAPYWYADVDGDGFGDMATFVSACSQPSGFVSNAQDCDDSSSDVHPGADDPCDGRDSDCDGIVEALWYIDSDGDGYGSSDEVLDACEPADGFVASLTDCDDSRPEVHPGHEEICGDQVENDCDGLAPGCGVAGLLELPAVEGFSIGGDSAGLHLGAVLAAGDLDGDGVTDLVAGGAEFDGFPPQGAIHVFGGGDLAAGLSSGADALILGGEAQFGEQVALAADGDFDGDGFVDLLVGGGRLDGSLGRVWLFLGPVTGVLGAEDADASGVAVSGSSAFGFSVAFVPDVDGDGRDEIAVGAPLSSGGRVYVFSGSATPGSLDPQDAHTVLHGEESSGLGWSVAGVEDSDGDGLGELLAGAPLYEDFLANGAWSQAGLVHLVQDFPEGEAPASDLGITLEPSGESLYLGSRVGSFASGLAEAPVGIFAGGLHVSPSDASTRAAAWVFPESPATDLPLASAGATLVGGEELGASGSVDLPDLRSLGDLDSDGLPELALSWIAAADGHIEVAVFEAPFDVPGVQGVELAAAHLVGAQTHAGSVGQAFCPVVALGSVDGDPWPELAVGSSLDSQTTAEGGAVYVLSGGPGL